MKTPGQPKQTWWFWKGKDKKSRKQLKQGLKKTKYFFLCFCQSSGEYELNSYTLFKRGIHRLQQVGSKIE
jgi:hypothetical protein